MWGTGGKSETIQKLQWFSTNRKLRCNVFWKCIVQYLNLVINSLFVLFLSFLGWTNFIARVPILPRILSAGFGAFTLIDTDTETEIDTDVQCPMRLIVGIGLCVRLTLLLITARIRRMGEGTVFGLSVHTSTGREGGYPSQIWMVGGGVLQPGLDGGGGGGYPGQVWMVGGILARSWLGGGYPSQVWMVEGVGTTARSWWWGGGVLQPGLDGGGYPGQVLMVEGGTQGNQLARSGWWWGVPQPGLDGGGYLGYPLARSGWWGGYPSQVLMVRGTPARSGWWEGGTLARSWWWGGTPARSWWWWGVPGVPLARTGWWGGTWGTPQPGLDGGGYLGYPPIMTGWGTPPPTIASAGYAAGGMPLAFTQEDFLVLYLWWKWKSVPVRTKQKNLTFHSGICSHYWCGCCSTIWRQYWRDLGFIPRLIFTCGDWGSPEV